jgi:hypothetical protein
VQRNLYKGKSPRCFVRLRFAAPDGTLHERELLADTGSPCAVILGMADYRALLHAAAASIGSNFGTLSGGWLKLSMPELELSGPLVGFGSDDVLRVVQADDQDFSGLVGLPLLRMAEYGGDAAAFWIRKSTAIA